MKRYDFFFKGNNCRYSCREELRGQPRTGNYKDIDWSKVANSVIVETKPDMAPIKISVSELLNRVKPQRKTALQTVSAASNVDTTSKYLSLEGVHVNKSMIP